MTSTKKTIEYRTSDQPFVDPPRAFGTINYKTDDRAMEPVRASAGAAGWDLYTVDDVTLHPFQSIIVSTGIKAALPEGSVLLILPRSGYSIKNQIIMPNSVGVIDEDYRGNIGISMMWTPDIKKTLLIERAAPDRALEAHWNPEAVFFIPKFTRIAQALLLPYLEQDWRRVDDLSETARGAGGFGHTGTGAEHARPPRDKDKIT